MAKTIRIPSNIRELREGLNNAAVGLAMSTLQRAGVLPYYYQSLMRHMRSGDDQTHEARSLGHYFATDPWFPRTVMLPAELIASWPARLHRRRRNGELRMVERFHPADDIINNKPNRDEGPTSQTALQFQCEAICWFIMLGTFYIRKGPAEMRQPVELHVLNPNHLSPILKGGQIAGYRYQRPNSGKPEEISLDELIIGRRFNPNSDVVGQGSGQPLIDTLEGRRLAAKWTQNTLRNDGSPSDVYGTSKEPMTQAQREKMAAEFDNAYGGPEAERAGKVPFFSGGVELKTNSRSPRDMQFQEWNSSSREDIGAGGGVSSRLLGDPKASTYNNLAEDRKALTNFNALPVATMFWDIINHQLVKPVYGADFEFVLDLSREPVFLEQNAAMVSELRELVNPPGGGAQIISVAEMRAGLRELMPTLTNVFGPDRPGDEVRTVAMGRVPADYNLNRAAPPAVVQPDSADGDDDPDGAEEGERAAPGTSPDRRGFAALFGPQRAAKPPMSRVVDGAFIEGVLYWAEEFAERAREISDTYHRALFEARLEEVAAELGIELADAFIDTDPRVVKYLRTYPHIFANYWSETTHQMLRTELELAVGEGETISQALERVDKVFGYRKNNAIVVAITQTTPSYNSAALATYAQAAEEGILSTKDWLPNTERHADVEGNVPVDGFFDVHGYPARYPGDPMLPIGEAAGCACSVAPGTIEEERSTDPLAIRSRTSEPIAAWAGRYEPSLRELLTHAQRQTRAALEALESGEPDADRGADDGRSDEADHARNGDGRVDQPVLIDRA